MRLFGGLGWRFEELTPAHMQQIGRAALLRPQRGVEIGRDLIFEHPDYASVSAPWRHSPTAAVMTLRRAWRIFAHPRFPELRGALHWRGTTPCEWSSRQLLELGMIEPRGSGSDAARRAPQRVWARSALAPLTTG